MPEVVAILGASNEQYRYAHKAQLSLTSHGHTAVPINPKYDMINGLRCYPNLASYPHKIDTITVYVRPYILSSLAEEIIHTSPDRIIFNPGTTDSHIIKQLQKVKIQIEVACTLVLLNTSQF